LGEQGGAARVVERRERPFEPLPKDARCEHAQKKKREH
jgi:hypothetical protein